MYLNKTKKGDSLGAKNYNIIPLSIDNGLNAVQIGTAGGYIRLLEAPATAEVYIHLNEKNADPIPLKVYHAIEATGIEKIFVTCNTVAGGIIKIVQADIADKFRMITPASTISVSEIGKIGDRFRPDGTAIQQTITAGSSYTFTKSNETIIRFHSTDEVGVDLNGGGVKYPMFEEELNIDNLSSLVFYNDNASDIVLTLWSM